MKLLLDACVWGGAAAELRAHGHDAIWAGDWESDPGDREILRIADAEQRALVTLDKDFGDLAVREGASHYGIIRLVGIGARRQARACGDALSRYGQELQSKTIAIVTVERGRMCIRMHRTNQTP